MATKKTADEGVKTEISLVTVDFQREDLNLLRDKINELITRGN